MLRQVFRKGLIVVNLRKKVYVFFSSFMLLLLVMYVIVFNVVEDLNGQLGQAAETRYMNKSFIDEVRTEVAEMGRVLRDPLLRVDDALVLEETFARHRHNATTALESMKLLDQDLDARPKLVAIQVQLADYAELAVVVMETIRGGDQERLLSGYRLEQASRTQLFHRIDEYAAYLDKEMASITEETEDRMRSARVIVLSVYFFILLGTTLLLVLNVRKIFDSVDGLISVMNNMALGSADSIERLSVNSDDEIGSMAQAYNRLADTLERHIRYERAYYAEIEEQNWLKTTIADITTMYQGVQDVQGLANRMLNKLAQLIHASYGAFYMAEQEDGRTSLRCLAAYAGKNEACTKRTFLLGEGLIGQCAAERQTIYLQQLPEESDYRVRSSILDSPPKELIVVPIEYEDQVLAVVEFATLTSFNALHQLLLQQVMNNAGITIHSVLGQMRVQSLLSDSQALTEELQSQSEELQQQQEELISTNEKLEEQYRSSELRSLELQSIKAELEEKARLLEQSSRYKTEFLANMSHELRTPLNSLLILSKILYDNVDGHLSDKHVEYAGALYSSSQHLLKLINDILDLSKAESGNVEVIQEQVRIQELLDFAENMFKPLAREKQLAFLIEQDPQLPETIYSDPQRIMQVMSNLLANAIKFTDQGSITLKVAGIGHASQGYEWISIAVTDTGIGIPAGKQELIFEAFRQADGTTSRKYGGTGLGLSISRNIAELLGGTIQVHSEEGQGSTFTLLLPHDQDARPSSPLVFNKIEAASGLQLPSAAATDEELEEGLADRTVLVVDDDIRSVYALTAALEAKRMTVLFAEEGYGALKQLSQHPEIDLVLMDLDMPELDGLAAIRELRSRPEHQHLPVIVVTAKGADAYYEPSMEAGASDFLSKPMQPEQLYEKIYYWLSQE